MPLIVLALALAVEKLGLRSIQPISSKIGETLRDVYFEPTSHLVPFISPILPSPVPHFLSFLCHLAIIQLFL